MYSFLLLLKNIGTEYNYKIISSWGPALQNWFIEQGIGFTTARYLKILVFIIITAIIAILVNWIAKKIILGILSIFIRKSKTKWDDILLEKRVFHRLSHFAPAIVIYFIIEYSLAGREGWINFLQMATYVYMYVVGLLVFLAFTASVNEIYNTLPASKYRSIKSYIQVVNIILVLITAILIISLLIGKSPGYLLGGLGAMAAVLMLVFKDSLLGLVAGIQIATNDLLRPGDWITMPSKGADGNVIDITLNTVKVQNFDKTITTIPTYSIVSESFSNWRGMEESDGRRIKRAVNIDINTIKLCDDRMIEKFRKIQYMNEYIDKKLQEIKEYNEKFPYDTSIKINGRRMTNIGTFRYYLENYLRNHPAINLNMTFLIRQLSPTENGVPIEVYVFSKIKEWGEYEKIQADIFDHIFAVLPEFELKAFQNPSGNDLQKIKSC